MGSPIRSTSPSADCPTGDGGLDPPSTDSTSTLTFTSDDTA
ncbi:MAG: hypothetical protein U1F23_00020 [Lysobacterales bacterium]